jgi:hypothetical protein
MDRKPGTPPRPHKVAQQNRALAFEDLDLEDVAGHVSDVLSFVDSAQEMHVEA